jgi:hypothetical protein
MRASKFRVCKKEEKGGKSLGVGDRVEGPRFRPSIRELKIGPIFKFENRPWGGGNADCVTQRESVVYWYSIQ